MRKDKEKLGNGAFNETVILNEVVDIMSCFPLQITGMKLAQPVDD